MKPKDLLEYSEKGDRTMEQLTGKTVANTVSVPDGLNGVLTDLYGQVLAGQVQNIMAMTGSGISAAQAQLLATTNTQNQTNQR